MDFRPDFADFRNFSGPYDGHTYSPPEKKNTETDRRTQQYLKKYGRTRTAFRNSVAISRSHCNPQLTVEVAKVVQGVEDELPL